MSSGKFSHGSLKAFNDVDDTMAKPVFGSDGAASWQKWSSEGVGKRALGHGPVVQKSQEWEKERELDRQVRRDNGGPERGVYSNFNTKEEKGGNQAQNADEGATASVGDDFSSAEQENDTTNNVAEFIFSEEFEGEKEGYVYEVRGDDVGYWHVGSSTPAGQPAAEKQDQQSPAKEEKKKKNKKKRDHRESSRTVDDSILHAGVPPPLGGPVSESRKKKKKRMKKKSTSEQEQEQEQEQSGYQPLATQALTDVEKAIAARNARVAEEEDRQSLAALGWYTQIDKASGKSFYYNRKTSETCWEHPLRPQGWSSAQDGAGRTYYFHPDGRTSWTMPPP